MAPRCVRFVKLFAFTLLVSVTAQSQQPLTKSWTTLQAGLTNKDIETRVTAVRLLGMLTGDAKAPELAIKALSDERPEVREAATSAIGAIKATAAKEELHKIIQTDKDPSVILGAARALLAMNDSYGYNIFYAVLTGEKKSGDSLMDEQKKMLHDPKKLAAFGFEQGIGFVPFGGIAYTAVKTLTKDDTSPVRAAAAKILAEDPDVKSLGALEEATNDKSWIVQIAAIAAIAQRNDQTTLSTLELRLDDPTAAVRYTAAAAIIHLNDIKTAKPTVSTGGKTPTRH
ncbi:MAG: HEAT repeat domain-containing protein [Edaphobacter sp.]|uniref:HEAT repeat domain-containing protein n=1 Tax=Edaphobacter sp. TaxID=1934404 RepID=UPI0023934B93|nr:HEAT repeat domain-containing protein [Edaphobacter sp.]MDE1177242.1 HEAT repeat domain-containing protein [Edaphobacter sp.]